MDQAKPKYFSHPHHPYSFEYFPIAFSLNLHNVFAILLLKMYSHYIFLSALAIQSMLLGVMAAPTSNSVSRLEKRVSPYLKSFK
jgi:hypothetical protein